MLTDKQVHNILYHLIYGFADEVYERQRDAGRFAHNICEACGEEFKKRLRKNRVHRFCNKSCALIGNSNRARKKEITAPEPVLQATG